MPARSKAQLNLMRAAAHGARFPLAQRVRASMSPAQIKDFEIPASDDLPETVTPKPKRRRAFGEVVRDALTRGR